MATGDHPDEHVLTALWSNALSPPRKGEVERHVASCSRCRTLLARLVRATPAETSPALVGDWWLNGTKAWAAASTRKK
jgi:anti-sigma factor RsiW